MAREMTERMMNLLDETHQQNVFVQSDGRVMCRQCHDTWPCDIRQLIDVFKEQGKLLEIGSMLNMQAYGLVGELVEAHEAGVHAMAMTGAEFTDDQAELVVRSKEYLAIGMPS